MTAEEHNRGYQKAKKIAEYLVMRYTEYHPACGIRWMCYGHRDAYYLVTLVWRLKRLA